MRAECCWAVAALAVASSVALADNPPVKLVLQDDQSVYGQPTPPSENEGVNAGGAHIDFNVTYLTDYVFRGINRDKAVGEDNGTNLQFDGLISFDLGKFPHPFAGVFVNVFDADPLSRFQEIRPYFGADLTIKPLILTAGMTSYIYPEREEQDTSEAWGKITLMDDVLLRSAEPLLSPYVLAAYDFDLYKGWYAEAGVEHTFTFENTGLTLTAQAAVAYVNGIELFTGPTGKDDGFQRYQLGLVAKYSLNSLLNVPRRLGEWSIKGYLYYTDGLSDDVKCDTTLWGGGGIEFAY